MKRRTLKRYRSVRRVSKRRASEKTKYRALREEFLLNHPWCEYHLKMNPQRFVPATEVHHTRGRAGSLYLDTRFWIALSAVGHDWVHNNMEAARQLGLLCERGQWNTPAPRNHNA